MSRVFSLADYQANLVRLEIVEAMRSADVLITRLLRKQESNEVLQLSAESITAVMDNDLLESPRNHIKRTGVWGVRLLISPTNDPQKSWIKKSNIWYRMLNAAASSAEIGFKESDGPDESPFASASLKQLPYVQKSVSGSSVLLCAVGGASESALREAVRADQDFDESRWDHDGYVQD